MTLLITSTSLHSSSSSAPPLAIATLRRAIRFSTLGYHRKAVLLAQGVVDTLPDFAPGWNGLATILMKAGNSLGAAVALHQTILLDPKHAPANVTLGEWYLKTGRPDVAREHLTRALHRIEDLSPTRAGWALLLLRRASAN